MHWTLTMQLDWRHQRTCRAFDRFDHSHYSCQTQRSHQLMRQFDVCSPCCGCCHHCRPCSTMHRNVGINETQIQLLGTFLFRPHSHYLLNSCSRTYCSWCLLPRCCYCTLTSSLVQINCKTFEMLSIKPSLDIILFFSVNHNLWLERAIVIIVLLTYRL